MKVGEGEAIGEDLYYFKKINMCGINGFTKIKSKNSKEILNKMNKSIIHRGPDDNGIFYNKKNDVGLGHVRLSILDLSEAGYQPMFYNKNLGASSTKFNSQNLEKSNISITYNGEIYNYKEIKKELENLGYIFSTHTDTEIILASYLQWGEDCVKKFNGMWAFCIFDKEKNILFCSRDRLGVKPFYYFFDGKEFVFSSEIKAILEVKNINKNENINKEALKYFFSLGFIPAPYTIYENCFKLESRQNLVLELDNFNIKKYNYFDIPEYKPEYNKEKLIKEGRELFEDATKIRMRADVEVGAFLSGGLDSTGVVANMKKFTDIKKIHTFSIGFKDKNLDETKYINIAKNYFKTKHHHKYFEENEFEIFLKDYENTFDEPFADFGFLPRFKISQIAKNNVKVILTGDGGDEIFGGYTSYPNIYLYEKIIKIPKIIRKFLFNFINIFKNKSDLTIFGKIRELLRWSLEAKVETLRADLYPETTHIKGDGLSFYSEKRMEIYKKVKNLTEVERLYNLFYSTMGDNFLTSTDRTTMKYSLEARSPFLDYRFIEFSMKIPTEWKVDIRKTKKILREILNGIVPDDILNLKKQGFTPPFIIYLKKNKDKVLKDIKIIEELDFVPNWIKQEYKKIKNGDFEKYINTVVKIYLFSLWYKKWIKNTK